MRACETDFPNAPLGVSVHDLTIVDENRASLSTNCSPTAMSRYDHLVQTLTEEIASLRAPHPIAEAFELLNPLSIGLRQKIPCLTQDARLFRIRKMKMRPEVIAETGAPPIGVAPVGRLNDQGQSVLYLADSPDTAFAEARTGAFISRSWH
jgi:hypothetical protein